MEIDVWILSLLFVGVSFLYSSVGLGGGSSYTALMAIAGVNHVALPTISLTLNVIVSALGSFQFTRRGHLRLRLIAPFLITSVPMAWIGGRLAVPRTVFLIALMATLILVAARIYLWPNPAMVRPLGPRGRILASFALGAVLGFTAGVVGIGGGIYLVPLILVLGLGDAKEAAAAGAVFILINSVVGLIARATAFEAPVELMLPLSGAVLVGGAAGSFLGAGPFRPRTVQRLLGVAVIIAIVLLARRIALG